MVGFTDRECGAYDVWWDLGLYLEGAETNELRDR